MNVRLWNCGNMELWKYGNGKVLATLMKGDILRLLVDGPMTCSEIAEKLGQVRGGGLSSVLQELDDAGFVSSDKGYNPETGKRARQSFYRLCDNYVRFFVKCSKLKLPDNVAMRTGLVYDGQLDPVVRGNAYFDVILSSREILGLQ